MRKILLSISLLLYPFCGFTQTPQGKVGLLTMIENPASEQEMFSRLDMKILHDREIVKDIIMTMYEQQFSPEKRANLTKGVFNEKDSEILESTMDRKRIEYALTPELLEKVDRDPYGAYQDFVRSASLPQLQNEEMEKLNQMDEKSVSRMMIMMTESGPDMGATSVPVAYDETQK